MPYQQAREIERRLQALVSLVREGRHATPALALALDTSEPTVARCLKALRDRGYKIRSVRGGGGWHYELVGEPGALSER